MLAAKEPLKSPPNGSQTTSPSSVDASIIRRIKSKGFWFKWAAFVLVLGALIRSFPLNEPRSQTLVKPCGQLNLARIFSHSEAVIGLTPSKEKYGLPSEFPSAFANIAIFSKASGGGKYHRCP